MWFSQAVLGALLVLPSRTTAQYGLQTHFGNVTYAGGMVYDPLTDRTYITGQVGASGCFLGVLGAEVLQFISKEVFAEPVICQDLTVSDQGDVMLLATTEEGGLYTDLRTTGGSKATLYGVLVPLDLVDSGSSALIDGGLLLHQDPVQYPRALLQDPGRTEIMYIASLHSLWDGVAEGFQSDDSVVPNQTPSGRMKYGSDYFVQIERVVMSPTEGTSLAWRKPYGLFSADMSEDRNIEFSNLLWNQDTLVLVGNTQGSGMLFGTNPHQENVNGFIAKLDPTSGQIWQTTTNLMRYSKYNGDGTPANTLVRGACSAGPNSKFIYLIGFYYDTAKNYKEIPFVTKINTEDLTYIWEQEYPGFSSNAKAFTCAVATDESSVVMAGVVHDGGSYSNDLTTSAGGDDIFVVELESADGHMQWIRQIGTKGNDHVVVNNEGIALTSSNHVIVYGDTDGDMYSTKIKGREIFIASIDKNTGMTWQTTETSSSNVNQGGQVPIKLITREASDHTGHVAGNAVQVGGSNIGNTGTTFDCEKLTDAEKLLVNECNPGGTDQEEETEDPNPDCELSTLDNGRVVVNDCNKTKGGSLHVGGHPSTFAKSSSSNGVSLYLVLFLVVALLVICTCCLRRRKEEKATERSTVFSYLHAFDLEDIEVRHSATGGWHGTYVGDLAKGETSRKSDFFSSSTYSGSHSSVVKDSLFLDFESRTSTRYRDHLDDLYDGIADAHGRVGEDDDLDNTLRLDEASLRGVIL
jgi:hypothetical protein